MLPLAMGLLGAGMSAYDSYQQNKLKKLEQERLAKADARTASLESRTEAQDPNRAYLQQLGNVEDATSAMTAKAGNIAGGNIANSGLSGDVSSAAVGASKTGALGEVFANSAMQKNQAVMGREQARANQTQQLESLNNQRLATEDRQIYTQDSGSLYSMIPGFMGGLNAGYTFEEGAGTKGTKVSAGNSKKSSMGALGFGKLAGRI